MIAVESVGVAGRLHGVSATFARGSVSVVIGPNGAGKSTLCGALAGSVRCDAGRVLLGGVDVATIPAATLARRRAAVGQAMPAPFPLTVREVVALGRLPHGDERGCDRLVDHVLAMFGLAELADRRWPTLSGGERQRAQVARALAQIAGVDGPFLLLDEPTSAADLGWQERVLALLRGRAREGATVVLILHDLNVVARWADHVVVLHAGRVAGHGAPADLFPSGPLDAAWGVRFHHAEVAGHPVLVPSLELP